VLSRRGGFSTFGLTLHDKNIENNVYDLGPGLQRVDARLDQDLLAEEAAIQRHRAIRPFASVDLDITR
jgi:hypothetical protein